MSMIWHALIPSGTWRVFLTGMICGIVLMACGVGAFVGWQSHPTRSAEDEAIYDNCLMERGDTVACGALMRGIDRERAAEGALKDQVAKMLAAGFNKREVAEWAVTRGFVYSQVSSAMGLSTAELVDLLKPAAAAPPPSASMNSK